MPAGGPFVLAATSQSGQSQTIDDVMVGDVWLCSGQSNMELPVARTLNADDEVRQAANDRIRLLSVAHADSPAPLGTFSTASCVACRRARHGSRFLRHLLLLRA